jgi:hypothetical protein
LFYATFLDILLHWAQSYSLLCVYWVSYVQNIYECTINCIGIWNHDTFTVLSTSVREKESKRDGREVIVSHKCVYTSNGPLSENVALFLIELLLRPVFDLQMHSYHILHEFSQMKIKIMHSRYPTPF